MMARCQLCEMVHNAVRTASGILSQLSPKEWGGMKGERVGGRQPEGGCSTRERDACRMPPSEEE